ncbi:uncharacterized protein [Aristolochia californica]|uniref:uncharacterized protein n=1 Tax=Aristolochia californica TaxID=171875 RepID=UPI0035D9DCD6
MTLSLDWQNMVASKADKFLGWWTEGGRYNRLSPIWKKIAKLLPVFKNVIKCYIGFGSRTRFWTDWWIGQASLNSCYGQIYSLARNKEANISTVGQNSCDWNLNLRRGLTERETIEAAELITSLSSARVKNGPNTLIWTLCPKGTFSALSAYKAHLPPSHAQSCHPSAIAWSLHVPPRAKFFIWTACQNKILTSDALIRWGTHVLDPLCLFCMSSTKTADHVLLHCNYAHSVWTNLINKIGLHYCSSQNLVSTIHTITKVNLPKIGKLLISCSVGHMIWGLWKERNNKKFNNKSLPDYILCNQIVGQVTSWIRMRKEFKSLGGIILREN